MADTLADDMGLGKTRQAIVSLRHLTPGGQRLVVCPASVKQNRAREIAVVAPDAPIVRDVKAALASGEALPLGSSESR